MILIPEELEAAIQSDPEDAQPYLVLGDLLQARGDPRGELITVQASLEDTGLTPERVAALRRRETELLAELRVSLLGVVAQQETAGWVELEWRRGFLFSARLPSPARVCSAAELAQVLEALFSDECPAARFLSRLRLGPALAEGREDRPPRCEYASLVKILCAAPRGLRSLELGDLVFPDEIALANVRLGSASLLGSRLPRLEELVLQGAGLSLRPLALPGLRRLALRLLRLERKQLAALLESRFEALEELELWIGEPKRRGAEPPLRVEELAPLLDRRRLPRLRTLRLLHCPFADLLASLCAQSSLAPALHTLDLSHGTLGRAGVVELAAGRLASLRVLELDGSTLSPEEGTPLLGPLAAAELRWGAPQAPSEPRIGLERWGRIRVEGRLLALVAALRSAREEGRLATASSVVAAAHRLAASLGRRELATSARGQLAIQLRDLGYSREAKGLLEDLLAIRERHGRPAELAWVRGTLALALDDLGERARADELFALALAGYRAEKDTEKEAWLLGCLAGQRLRSGETEAARVLYEQALEMHRAKGNRSFEAHLLGQLGALYMQAGKLEAAREPFASAVAVLRELGNERELAKVLGNLAGVHWQLGEWDEVERLYGAAIESSRRLGDRRNVAFSLSNLALSFLVRGQLERVEAPAEEALALFRATGHRQGEAWTLGSVLGPLATGRNQLAEARRHLEAALAIQREAGERRGEGITLVMLGNVCLDGEELEQAARCYREGLEIARAVENQMSAGDALEGLAACELAAGRFAEASEHCQEAIAGFQRIGWPRGEGGALLSLGRVQQLAGDPAAAENSYRRGLKLQREVGNGQLVARTLVWLAVLCADGGRLEEAGAALEEAERTLEPSDAQGHEQRRLAAARLDCARARATRDPRAADRLLRAAREAVASPATSFEARGLGELVRAALAATD